MKFRTEVPIFSKEPKIDYDSQVFLLGSCFVENIGRKLEYFRFRSLINPFGILFHPAALRKFLRNVEQQAIYSEKDVFYHNEMWHCFDAHSDRNSSEKGKIIEALNSAVEESFDFLKNSSHVILTLGTAWGYRNLKSAEIVANCHKFPQNNFLKELTEVKNDLFESVQMIRRLNASATIILTVSPVRHLKDGFTENQRSKARLISAVHETVENFKQVDYFPSYEIMIDELRDYRFCAEDMVHPNAVAIDYIWQKFREAWISSEALEVMKKVDSIQKGLLHKPFNESSQGHQDFITSLNEKISKLQKSYPQVKFH